jgi:hypothetical protein
MRRALVLSAVLAAAPAFAGPSGAGDPQAASATGFPGAYLGTIERSLRADPRYGSRLLDALDEHLQAVGVMTGPREVADYLEQSAGGSEGVESLRPALGREPLDTMKAAGLLLAEALSRPEQFREVLEGLESLKHGVGRHAAELLRGARGAGDKRLFAALHAAVARKPGEKQPSYIAEGRITRLFDAKSIDGRDGVVLETPDASDEGHAPRPRASERSLPAQR